MAHGQERFVVLQVLPSLVTGGVERGTVEVARAVAEAEGTALVASAGGPMVAEVETAGGRHLALPLDTKDPRAIWRNAARLAELIRRERVDIVHARSRAPAWSAWLACRRTGAHFVTTYHGTYGEALPLKRQYNAVMAKGEVVIAASPFIAGLVAARHRVEPGRLRIIPRGVDPAAFDPAAVAPERMAALAAAWNLPAGAPVVMLPGRLTAWKGQGVLIEAMALLSRRDAICVLVGADQGRHRYTEQLLRRAGRLGIGDRLRLAGHAEDMPAALALADVVVHASTKPEAFGRVVIEAQAMARPVIAADLGGPVDTVAHGLTGWRVAPGNPVALAAAIDEVLALPPDRRATVGARARAAVPTVRGMQQATLEVYADVRARPGRG